MRARIPSVLACLALTGAAAGQPTAFTCRGRPKNGAAHATGLHDFRFTLFNAASVGVQFGTPQCTDSILVFEGTIGRPEQRKTDFARDHARPSADTSGVRSPVSTTQTTTRGTP